VRDRLTSRVSEVAKWCASRRLQLNDDKTEMIWFGSRSNLAKLQSINLSLQVGTGNVQPSSVVRDLGVYMDSELTMKEHVSKIPQPVSGDSESNTDWATVASTPLRRRNRFAVLSTVTEVNMVGDQFTLVQSRRAAKRAGQQSSSPSHSSSQQQHQQQQRQPSRKSTLLGKAATGRSSALSTA